jgi:hypothetical protein
MSFPSPVAVLDSIMDAQGLDLFDTPMDYEVTYEGGYYQDPSIPDSRGISCSLQGKLVDR